MINLKEFILDNLKKGVKNGSFTKEYANILLVNYSVKGIITQEDVALISAEIEADEEPVMIETESMEEGV